MLLLIFFEIIIHSIKFNFIFFIFKNIFFGKLLNIIKISINLFYNFFILMIKKNNIFEKFKNLQTLCKLEASKYDCCKLKN